MATKKPTFNFGKQSSKPKGKSAKASRKRASGGNSKGRGAWASYVGGGTRPSRNDFIPD